MKSSIRLLPAGVVFACALGGCAHAPPPGGPPPLPVSTAPVVRRAIATTILLDGQIAPLRESTLGLPQSGTLASVEVTEGDRVRAGQVLARIDDSTLQAQLGAARAAVDQATAALAGATRQLPIQSGQLGGAVVQAQQQLEQNRNALSTAVAAEATARTQLLSDEALAKQGYLAQTVLDQQRSQEVATQQQVRSAQNGVQTAQAALAVARGNVGETGVQRSDVAAKRSAIAQARAQQRLLETEIAQTVLHAPYDGAITQRLLDPGAFAGPNAPILRISDVRTVYVNANVPDEDLAFVRPGTPVRFSTASLPGRHFDAVVSETNATPTQGTLSYRARLRVPNATGELRGGMLVSLDVRRAYAAHALVVPRGAVADGPAGTVVYVVSEGKAHAVPVRIGVQNDDAVQVLGAGLEPGTLVVATRPDALADGAKVAVVTPSAPAP